MARALLLIVAFLVAASIAGSEFLPEDNPIRQVIDGLHKLESSILKVFGNSRHALSFARFAHRYGRRYKSSEEMPRRFEIFVEGLRMIRSHNKKGLSYTIGINGNI